MAQQYFIEDGVHRAVAARENGLRMIPAILMMRWEDKNVDLVREILTAYQEKYPDGYDYLSILSMNDGEFRRVFMEYQYAWAEA